MRIAVAQLGARRHYLVPYTLHKHQMLGRFYTDLYVGGQARGALLQRIGKALRLSGPKRLAGRRDRGLAEELVTSYPLFGLQYRIAVTAARSQTELTRAWLWGGHRFAGLVARADLGSADAVYAYTSAARELFEAAKAQGIPCILDHATAPKSYEDGLVNEEIRRYPRWTTGNIKDCYAEEYTARQREEWELADLIICSSTFVREAIARLGGPVGKAAVLPLGLRSCPAIPPVRKRRGDDSLHVLFVGDDAMRKGVGDFVDALRLAGPRDFPARVVGRIKLTRYGRQRVEEVVDVIGAVPRSDIGAQYSWADVLVLPSVSDTFGLVILEAMAHGVPVIASSHTGAPDIIRDGTDGFVVPPMAPDVIAERLSQLRNDGGLLDDMSHNCFERCLEFSHERYARGLLTICDELRMAHRES